MIKLFLFIFIKQNFSIKINNKFYKIFILIFIFLLLLASLNYKNKFKKIDNNTNINNNNITNITINDNNKKLNNISNNNISLYYNNFTLNELINKLLLKFNKTKQKYIIFSDYFHSKYCDDFNAYYIFKYYQQKNISNSYYIINVESDLYNRLIKKNETQNLILYNTSENFWRTLYKYLLHTKIIVQSYTLLEFQLLVNKLPYLKYLKINHGVRYFKKNIGLLDLNNLTVTKRNIITSSPFEYELYKKYFNYTDNYIHKAGIARYDRFKTFKKNNSEKECILITFTYRAYNNTFYLKSLYKKNIEKLLSDKQLISFLNAKNIDLIYISHHKDLLMHRNLNLTNFKYIKYMKQNKLAHYIEQCSLLVTDFSSIAFDFMFQNKPTLFYLIDVDDSIKFEEKKYMKNSKNVIYFGNVYKEKKILINKIKFYINKHFNIDHELKKKYEIVFYYKNNITEKIIDIINNIIKN